MLLYFNISCGIRFLNIGLFMEEDASKLASQLIEASLVKNAPDDKLDLSSLVTCSFNSLGSEVLKG